MPYWLTVPLSDCGQLETDSVAVNLWSIGIIIVSVASIADGFIHQMQSSLPSP